jgi:cysteine desulfurase
MTANNETGAIQSISTLSRLVKEMVPAALFHTDATQAVGKISISVDRDYSDVDLLSLSAHKFHGPKGIGALFIREGTKIAPLILGGGQENGRRSGTTNVPGAVGIGVASTLAAQALRQGSTVSDIRDRMETRLRNSFSDIVVHASQAPRLPNTSCFSLPGCSANSMADLLATKGFYVGTGSACSSGALEPPRTLIAMGVDYETARSALRVSLSRYSREEESESLVEALATARGSFLHSV